MNALMRATRTTPIPKPNVLQVKYQHFLDSTSTNSKENKSLDAAWERHQRPDLTVSRKQNTSYFGAVWVTLLEKKNKKC